MASNKTCTQSGKKWGRRPFDEYDQCEECGKMLPYNGGEVPMHRVATTEEGLMTYSRQFVSDTARAWLTSQVRSLALDPYDAMKVYSEVMETRDLDSMGDYLDGVGYPELAEQWARDWHVEDISVEELYVELTEGEGE